jgi:DNA-binding NarL/FixJ family response regulator
MSRSSRILLVDDHDFLRRGLRTYFEREKGITIIGEARTAEESYECMNQTPADVVVMDLQLPGDDGIAAAQKIKARWPHTKVLILSGKTARPAGSSDVERALLAGVDGFVSKQDGEACIWSAIEAVLQGRNFLSPVPATELVRRLRARPAADRQGNVAGLTDRETTVLQRLAEAASYKDIAAELEISVKSVDTYRTRLTRKLGLNSREDLLQYAIQHGLVGRG